jgi:hypothetical protein
MIRHRISSELSRLSFHDAVISSQIGSMLPHGNKTVTILPPRDPSPALKSFVHERL